MNNLMEILIIGGVIAFQTVSGYMGNKYMGAILPVVFSGLVIYIIVAGHLNLSFRNVLMPIIGFVTLICIYEGGKESKKKKTIKEMEKMKAKDILNK
jgi:NhaP-type Na+/H+ or K+/H+ antiporter